MSKIRTTLLSLALGVGLTVPLAQVAQADPPVGGFDVSPTAISHDVEVKNPMRGQYLWYGQTKTPDLTGPDNYSRMFWNEIETDDQVFDTSRIDAGLAKAEESGGTYGFRVMSVCDWCSSDMIVLPPQLRESDRTWIAQGDSGPLEIPDWNSEEFLTQWEDLMSFLGSKYADDPRLGWIDVGGYGNWGEWHSYPFEGQYPGPGGQTDITLASSLRIVRAVEQNFPHTPVLLNTTGSRQADIDGVPGSEATHEWSNQLWQGSLAISDHIGVRNDCLGAGLEQDHAKDGLLEASRYARENGGIDPLERWKTAPFITEYCAATKPPVDIDGNGVIDEWERHDYTGDGVVEDWELEEDYGSFDKALQQVQDWHISLTSSDNYSGDLADFPEADQEDFLQATLRAGYRYELGRVQANLPAGSAGSVTWTWKNVNVAPTYSDWDVVLEFRLPGSSAVAASVTSSLELSTVLPGAPAVHTDAIPAGTLQPGSYDVYVKVTDADRYFAPLALGIEGRRADGAYLLASGVTVGAVTPDPEPEPGQLVNQKAPAIMGTVAAGQKVKADPGSWSESGLSFTYQWELSGKKVKGATDPSYKVPKSAKGKKLSVVVTASKSGFASVSATSTSVKVKAPVIKNTTKPKITGKVKVGKVVAASPGKWSEKKLKFSYTWKLDGKKLGHGGKYLRIPSSAKGKKLTVTVKATRSGFTSATVTSRTMKVAKR